MTAAARVAAHEPLLIYVSRDRNGVSFALDPLSHRQLRAALPADRHVWPLVFIRRETADDFQELELALQDQVVRLLTGLEREEAGSFGGVVFMAPDESNLAVWPPVPR